MYLQAWKRSYSARLPQFSTWATSKTKQFFGTPSILEHGNVKNEEILRDFSSFRSWQNQKRSNSARLPSKMESWVQRWRLHVARKSEAVFFHCFVAPEGRKVGSLKQRVRSHPARWEMNNCTPLWREQNLKVFVAVSKSLAGVVIRDFSTFSRTCIFFFLTLSLLWYSFFFASLLFSSLILPTSAFSSVHILGSLTSKLPSIIWNKKIHRHRPQLEKVSDIPRDVVLQKQLRNIERTNCRRALFQNQPSWLGKSMLLWIGYATRAGRLRLKSMWVTFVADSGFTLLLGPPVKRSCKKLLHSWSFLSPATLWTRANSRVNNRIVLNSFHQPQIPWQQFQG